MSWSVQTQGTKEAVAAYCKEKLGKSIERYEAHGANSDMAKAEANDIRNALDSILRAIDLIEVKPDTYVQWRGVKVSANGSRSNASASMTVSVERMEFRQD